MATVIRPLRDDDLDAVARAFQRHPDTVAGRLALQREQTGVYLIAWDGATPVGQTLVRFSRDPAPWVPRELAGLPYLEDVYVPHDLRSRGIGTLLLEEAERVVREHGRHSVSLAVNVDNLGAQRLYRRLGYAEAAAGPHEQPWSHHDPHGRLHSHSERVVDMVKRLR